jgi:DUF438 domain-containing protein
MKRFDENVDLNLLRMTEAVAEMKSAIKWLNEAQAAHKAANEGDSTEAYQSAVTELVKAEHAFDSAQHDCVNHANYFRNAVQEMSIDAQAKKVSEQVGGYPCNWFDVEILCEKIEIVGTSKRVRAYNKGDVIRVTKDTAEQLEAGTYSYIHNI